MAPRVADSDAGSAQIICSARGRGHHEPRAERWAAALSHRDAKRPWPQPLRAMHQQHTDLARVAAGASGRWLDRIRDV